MKVRTRAARRPPSALCGHYHLRAVELATADYVAIVLQRRPAASPSALFIDTA